MLKKLSTMLVAFIFILSGFQGYANSVAAAPMEEISTHETGLDTTLNDDKLKISPNDSAHCENATAITKTEIEQRRVSLDEKFNVKFSVDAIYTIESYTYETTGFEVESQLTEVDNQIIISLRAIKEGDKPIFKLHIDLQEDVYIEPAIYGFINKQEIFLSSSSFDDAWSYHLEYLISQQLITPKEAEQMRIEHNKPYVQEEIRTEQNPGPATRGVADTWVRGRLQWRDDKGDLHPLQYIALDVRDEDLIDDDILGTNIFTDENGEYVFGFANQTIATEQGGCDPYIMVYAIGIGLNVMVNNYYAQSSTVKNVPTGSTTYIDMTFTMDNDLGQAFQILQAAVTASQYITEMNDTDVDLGLVRILYPFDDPKVGSGCYYDHETKSIMITGAPAAVGMPQAYASWDVIMHEYMHHIQYLFDVTDSPGQKHILDSSMSDHYAGTNHANCGCAQPGAAQAKYEGLRISWGEAWPTVLGIMSQQYYQNRLSNIRTVCDSSYTAYNRVDYDLEYLFFLDGEACEGTICGVLYDLYDPLNEAHDNVEMGHEKFFKASIESKAKTLSEFVNYCYENVLAIDPISVGEILSHFLISPNNFRATNGITKTPPTFSWNAGIGSISSNYRNNSFRIVFYNEGGYEIFKTNEIKSTNYTVTYTLTQNEWNQVLTSFGTTFKAGVYGYQTSYPATGGYLSELVKFTKPAASALTENLTFDKNLRYYETTVSLQPGQYIDYVVRFAGGGGKTFQTFGTKDTCLYLFSERGIQHEFNDDGGYGSNAIITEYLIPDTNYIVRLKFYSSSEGGTVKLGIMEGGISSFEENPGPYSTGDVISRENVSVDATRHIVPSSGTYTFYTDRLSEDGAYNDTYMYLIDPTSTEPCMRDDDSGGYSQAKITATLQTGIEYLLITAPFTVFNGASYKLYFSAV